MLIACDLDNVLAELITPLLNFHNSQYKTSFTKEQITRYDLSHFWKCTRKEAIRRTHDFYQSLEFNNIPLIPGAKEGIFQLSQNYDLVIITSRPKAIQNKTTTWINKHFPGKFKKIYYTNQWAISGQAEKKSSICHLLKADVFIEDCLEEALECIGSKTRILLFNSPWNQKINLPKEISRVYNWEEILNSI